MSAAQPLISDLVDQHYQTLYRFALSLARNEADASDLTQQTFFLFATKGQQLRDPKKAKSWLATTLYREFLHNKRRSNRFDPIATPSSDSMDGADEPSFTPDLPQQLDAASALEALQSLPERYRAPLTLFYLEDYSYLDIAEILQIPIGTVMSRLSRAKQELHHQLTSGLQNNTDNIIPIRARA